MSQANIEARCRAEGIVDLIGEESPRFWEELARLATEKLPAKPAPVDPFGPMDEREAARFEVSEMTWGKHAGEPIGMISTGYIGWLAENDFAIQLRRYVKSASFQRRQENEESE